ncbi:MAG: carbon-nitrogen hydrolase family protein [Peptococcaceae bacterium]|nr:carbon-nitrogen hydrolase family protein [Peptococcaceae bacterium]
MANSYLVAAIQMDSQDNKENNLQMVAAYLEEAAKKGAALVVLPEVMNGLSEEPEFAETIPGPTTDFLCAKACELQIWICGGSISEICSQTERTLNTSVLIAPTGEIVAKYSKLHNFDVTLPDGTGVCESLKKQAGKNIITVNTPLGKLGFAICYDLRFPELFRLMALEGAEIILLPANFTQATGKDHWEPLLRARAIENGCYLIAANQTGQKQQFTAYGNSMIIDPWGNILARAGEKPEIIYAAVDLELLAETRQRIPSLQNRRTDIYQLNKEAN